MANEEFKNIKLDKGKPFGVVFPPEGGAHFEQDGFFFDAFGELSEEMMTDESKLRLRKHIARQQADVAAHKARMKALKAAGFEDDNEVETVVKKIAEIDEAISKKTDGEVDLVGWAKGFVKKPWFAVRSAAEKEYSFHANTAETLLEFMIDNGYVGKDDVRTGA